MEQATQKADARAFRVRARAILSRETAERWPELLLSAGWRIVAPVLGADGVDSEYVELKSGSARATGLGKGVPRHSPKEAWFPRTEPILILNRQDLEWQLEDPSLNFPPTVIFGARACDAAAMGVLAPLFGWDYHDPFFEERARNLAFVVVACKQQVDDACFCTTTGVDPAGEGLGDVLLTELPDGDCLAEAYTEKGERLLEAVPSAQRKPVPADLPSVEVLREAAREAVAVRFDPRRVRTALEKRFNDPLWERAARSCIGCGVCAFSCPTCHCFDIQDDLCGCRGIRQKNWDCCSFPLFTVHTSGHNPRPDQGSRWRQRLSHKFRYYPDKFGHALCTGCGRCVRLCPAGMDMIADLKELGHGEGAEEAETRIEAELSSKPVVIPATPAPNVYRPYRMRVADLHDETPDVRTLRLEFNDPKEAEAFSFKVGQFGLYGAFGEGECTFCIASSPTKKGYIECTFRKAGRVTQALRRLDVGDQMGFRGPYGNSFPVEQWKDKNLLFIAGGIALPPVRSVIQYCLDHRADYKDVTIVYGARTWSDHVYKDELAEWEKRPDTNLWLCIDWKPAPDGKGLSMTAAEEGWLPLDKADPGATTLDPAHRRYTAFVPQMVEAAKTSPNNCVAILCGPPIMIKFTLMSLKKLGFESKNVYTTLENRMKCGIGKCGRCNVGPVYVCKEGPVFTAEQIEQLPAAEL